MKRILVPTDFSANAQHALKYAVMLAKKTNAEIILLHTWLPGADTLLARDITMTNAKIQAKIDAKLEAISKKFQTPKIKFRYASREGNLQAFIKEIVKKQKIDLVVMGTKGAGKITGRLFGSNTSKEMETTECPLIAVPAKIKLTAPKKIVFATDYFEDDAKKIKQLSEFAALFNAAVEVLHVSDLFDVKSEKKFMLDFANKVARKIPYKKIKFKVILGYDVNETLKEYTKKNHMDLLAMTTVKRNLFDKIFIPSITKKASYSAKIPLFVFHQK